MFIGLLIAMYLCEQANLLTGRGELLLVAPSWTVLLVIAGASLVTCYYVFRVGSCEAGLGYAFGHLLLCIALTLVLLIGIIVVPLQVRSDIHRWRGTEGALPDD